MAARGAHEAHLSPVSQPETDGRVLVARVRSGDQAAFETIFRRYYEPLWRFAIGHVESPDIARELVHDVFFRVWERRERWDLSTSLGAYLYTATRNAALNHLRHAEQATRWQRRVSHVVDSAEREDATGIVADSVFLAGPARLPDDIVVARDEADALRSAVTKLPDRQRQALVLRWYHGLTHPEIARVLGVSVKAVESLMVRAMTSLRGQLGGLR